jgi:putative hydrolase of HD superfamily
MIDNNKLLDFIAEAGKLKYIKRSGWWMLGIPREESVADHSFRCAVIGYILAKMEKADTGRVLLMTLFNDIHEARITDLHKVAHKYFVVKEAENKAYKDQVKKLPEEIRDELTRGRIDFITQESLESLVARDADILECLIQCKEYIDQGFPTAEKFFKKGPFHLKTKSAKALWEKVKSWNSNEWWEKLGEFER